MVRPVHSASDGKQDVYNAANIPFGSAHVCLLDAHSASRAFGNAVLSREPARLTIVGNSSAFQHHEGWFASVLASHSAQVSAPRRVPWYALCETLAEAMASVQGVSHRILCANRNDQQDVLVKLRGSSDGVRVGDPVYHWQRRRRAVITGMCDALGRDLRESSLSRPGLRISTTLCARCHGSSLNIGLIDTPSTLHGYADAIVVLPNVPPIHTLAAEQHARVALIGVGRAFAN